MTTFLAKNRSCGAWHGHHSHAAEWSPCRSALLPHAQGSRRNHDIIGAVSYPFETLLSAPSHLCNISGVTRTCGVKMTRSRAGWLAVVQDHAVDGVCAFCHLGETRGERRGVKPVASLKQASHMHTQVVALGTAQAWRWYPSPRARKPRPRRATALGRHRWPKT